MRATIAFLAGLVSLSVIEYDAAAQKVMSRSSNELIMVSQSADPRSSQAPSNSSSTLPPPRDPAPSSLQAIQPVESTIRVSATAENSLHVIDVSQHITQSEVMSSAGTFGDFTRYMQILPAVVWNSDITNEIMVRGGNPSENLFVVDGFEVPNINHISVEGSTGGFTSMIDTSTVASIDMEEDGYNPRYSSRLSSLVDIHTLGENEQPRSEIDLGISGLGATMMRPIGKDRTMMLAAHRSILNWFTDDIGLNGVPIYTNGIARLNWKTNPDDHVSVLSLDGADSIAIKPCAWNEEETLFTNTQYDGQRSTQGVQWQHTHTPRTVSLVTGSYAVQQQSIAQQLQSPGDASVNRKLGAKICEPAYLTDVYQEHSRDGLARLGYEFDFASSNWYISTGTTVGLLGTDYRVAQPVGEQSPFNPDPTWTDSDNFNNHLQTGQTGFYVDASRHTNARWSFLAGARFETYALTGSHAINPRASIAFRLNSRQAINLNFNRASQLPPTMNVLSYPQNRHLRPIAVRQISLGVDLWRSNPISAQITLYDKHYSDEPISIEYPSVSLANMVEPLGQQFVWIPLKSGGTGQADGASALIRFNWARRLHFLGSTTYSKVRYAGADGIMRPGNFDIRFVGNGLISAQITRRLIFSARNTYTSGRPYTPFDFGLSFEQSRGIYDLGRVNGMRGPAYNRLDTEFAYELAVRNRPLTIHFGIDNFFNRKNFLGYAWCSRWPSSYVKSGNSPVTMLYQLVRFPTLSASYRF